ncbi:hypothetical protein NC652_010441 [Populus alba x Populus x berolinensis]|nr:hypothetical protein NC652_010441 [Populus alba x Populus x berolinensis]
MDVLCKQRYIGVDDEWSLLGFVEQEILRELCREWPGDAYDLLAKNCNHFCDEFCERLGVPKLPDYPKEFLKLESVPCLKINWPAVECDLFVGLIVLPMLVIAAMEVAGNTAFRFRQAKTEIVSASKVA